MEEVNEERLGRLRVKQERKKAETGEMVDEVRGCYRGVLLGGVRRKRRMGDLTPFFCLCLCPTTRFLISYNAWILMENS